MFSFLYMGLEVELYVQFTERGLVYNKVNNKFLGLANIVAGRVYIE